jgi:alpha-mannosidase
MKEKGVSLQLFIVLLLAAWSMSVKSQTMLIKDVRLTVKPMYGYRVDGKPGREIQLDYIGGKLTEKAIIKVEVDGKKETITLKPSVKADSVNYFLLPENVGKEKETKALISIKIGNKEFRKELIIPAMRYWTLFLYNHSHVDIGYTNTQKNVEILHKTNVLEGIKLAKETQHFPEGSRFKWNPEVTWPVERLWKSHPQERENILQAIRDDQLTIDASYLNLNTSICADEEIFHIFKFSRQLQRQTGKPIDVFQQFDIPGISWGMVPVMAQEGVKYIISWINGSDRVGNAHKYDINHFPFWWIGPDGKSKVLFFQPGRYANSGSMTKGGETGRPWFGQRDPSKVPPVIKTGSANVDFTATLVDLEKSKYPYDFQVFSWTLWDNNPLDADVPYAVKEWNEKYAYPKIIIAGGHEIMRYIEDNYGDKLPEVKGDYTEYWTDGLGTAAGLTAMNRNAKERLIQAEKLWSMLNSHRSAPREELDEAWRSILMGSEHTWCFENPSEPYFQNAIFKVKQDYFRIADERSQEMFDEALASVTDKSDGGLGPAEGPAAGGIAVFNTNSWNHGGVVTLDISESRRGNKVIDENGEEVPAQRLSTGELIFMAKNVPALGSRHYRVTKGESSFSKGCTVKNNVLENGKIRVTVDAKSGNITQLIDLKTGYNYVDEKVNGGINAFRWLPGNIDSPVADSLIQITVVENGPLLVELNVQSQCKGVRSVNRNVRLVADQPWVEFNNVVDKLPLIEKDGIHFGFGFNIPQGITRVDIPWGVMEVEKDQIPQANRNWIAMQRWLNITNDRKGVTWVSLDAPLFQYGSMSANNAHGWGNKGTWIEKLNPSSTVYSWVMNNHWHTNFPLTQDGPVLFRYRVMIHDSYNAAMANRFGMEQSQPLVHVATSKNPEITPFVEIDNPNVVVSMLRSTEDKDIFVLRLRSLSDKEEMVKLSFPKNPVSVHLCDLEEKPSGPVSGSIQILPYGMTTIKVEM